MTSDEAAAVLGPDLTAAAVAHAATFPPLTLRQAEAVAALLLGCPPAEHHDTSQRRVRNPAA